MYCPSCDTTYPLSHTSCPADQTALIAVGDDDALVGTRIGDRFTLKELLGAGGMGRVYIATQHSVGRDIAIKVIAKRSATATKRFLREAKLQSRLSDPHVVTVFDFGSVDDHLFIAMELLDGESLDRAIKSSGAMDPSRVIRIGAQICQALDAAHALDIVHRDLKPANIQLLSQSLGGDFIKVLDFGLAKLMAEDQSTVTGSGQLVGTPAYMAPETARGEASVRSDLYSLGVVLFAMLAGQRPFDAATVPQMLHKHAHEPPPPLPESVPDGLKIIVFRLLKKEPGERFASAAEVRTRLEDVAAASVSQVSQLAVDEPVAAPSGLVAHTASFTGADPSSRAEAVEARTVNDRAVSETLSLSNTAGDFEPTSSVVAAAQAGRARGKWALMLSAVILTGGLATWVALEAKSRSPDGELIESAALSVPASESDHRDGSPVPKSTTDDHTTAGAASSPELHQPVPQDAAAVVRFEIHSKPSASVRMGDRPLGRTPLVLSVVRGATVDIELRKKGYHPARRTLQIGGPGETMIELNPRRKTTNSDQAAPKPPTRDRYIDPD